MSDEVTTDPVETEPQGEPAEDLGLGDAGKKAIAAEREARRQAEKQASEFRARLDEIEQANLSELEKAQKRAEAAEAALREKEAEALKYSVAAKHGITGEYLDLLFGSSEEELSARAERIASLIQKTPAGPVIPDQGRTPSKASTSPADSFARFVEERLSS